jgi:hypothetical protein
MSTKEGFHAWLGRYPTAVRSTRTKKIFTRPFDVRVAISERLGRTHPRACEIDDDMLHLNAATPVRSGKEINLVAAGSLILLLRGFQVSLGRDSGLRSSNRSFSFLLGEGGV